MEVPDREWQRGEYTISTDNARLDISTIHDFISNQSYWGQGRRMDSRRLCVDGTSGPGTFEVANGNHSWTLAATRLPALGVGDEGCAVVVRALWFYPLAPA